MSQDAPEFVIVGALGMLGRAWRELLARRGVRFVGIDRDEVDITDPATIPGAVPAGARVIVNCAAYTNVDGAEDDYDAARLLNGDAVSHLAKHAAAIGATLIHYSTDYVFNGQATEPYAVDAPHDPINAYGRSKAEGESALWASDADHLLIRTSWLYAPWANNFVRTMLKLTAERDTLRVVDDQRGRPTSAQHLAAASLALLETGERGSFHVTDGGACTWCEFTRAIAQIAGHDCDVQACTTDQFPRPARRPAYSVLDLSRTEALLGPMPDWRDNTAAVIAGAELVKDFNHR